MVHYEGKLKDEKGNLSTDFHASCAEIVFVMDTL